MNSQGLGSDIYRLFYDHWPRVDGRIATHLVRTQSDHFFHSNVDLETVRKTTDLHCPSHGNYWVGVWPVDINASCTGQPNI
jgi:hypothetical protein